MNNKYVKFESVNRSLDEALKIYKQRIRDSIEVYDKFNKDFINRPCPFCGNMERENRKIKKFHNTYKVEKCTRCASNFVNPCPNLTALNYYYNECACNQMLGNVYRNRPKNKIASGRAIHTAELIKNIIKFKKTKQLGG
jgi:hypothetical protein